MTRLQAFREGAMSVITIIGFAAAFIAMEVIAGYGRPYGSVLQKIVYVLLSDPNPYR